MSAPGTAPTGFVGLGNMGGRIARRITDAGTPLLGHDRETGRVREAGAEPAADLAEIARRCDTILLSLPDSTVVEAVVEGEGGLLAHARPGQTVVDLSTSAPASTVRLHGLLAERGAVLLDAGVTGGAAAAERGALTVMAGGPDAELDRLADLFGLFAARVHRMGAVGAGHSAKLLNNFLNAVSLAATAEVMVAGDRAGLDPAQLLEVFNSGSGMNFATRNRFPHIVRGDYLEGGLTGDLMLKDVLLYLAHLRDLGVPSLNAAGPVASFGAAARLGYGDLISNRVFDALGDLAGAPARPGCPDPAPDQAGDPHQEAGT
ncbi:NAD(P)-dependent oxidoreductase [Streptomyces tagetis]|uniref:NAD(P)-dependent oxidoreductase n=1 Tax=Streptomyces tagetis TaxID=2820809 RepID=A0A940XDR2_9ACTN|nr:NAD(P)-dependent oxidoreductase [Streptomyces sp. RG38]MBQ0826545.1 NAD(P)-dependent oxidoreductase [Streptomyces sp. RG38]